MTSVIPAKARPLQKSRHPGESRRFSGRNVHPEVRWATRPLRAHFVLLPRRSRFYSAWHISPRSGRNPDRLGPAVEVLQRSRESRDPEGQGNGARYANRVVANPLDALCTRPLREARETPGAAQALSKSHPSERPETCTYRYDSIQSLVTLVWRVHTTSRRRHFNHPH